MNPDSFFILQNTPIRSDILMLQLQDSSCGACVQFEGWVRNSNEGKTVESLEYEAFEDLCYKEAKNILLECFALHKPTHIYCVHRVGTLQVGEAAVWVGVSSPHRKEAFAACAFMIDEIKSRLPIWKKEFYTEGIPQWVACHRCANTHRSSHTGHKETELI